jgi:enhancing lycopene biosynthesis protein 2
MVKNLPTVERSTKIRFGKNCTDDQAENTIVFNASNVQINADYAGSVYMTPLRVRTDVNDRNITMLTYNRTTKEVMDSGAIAEDVLQFDLEDAVRNGNVTANTVSFNNAITSFTTLSNVGIANGSPIHTLDIGSNVAIDDVGSNVVSILGGNVYIQKDLIVDGNAQINGVVTVVNTENLSITDAIVELGRNNTSEDTTTDLGLLMNRPGSNVVIGFREGGDEIVLAYTQSSASSKTITPLTNEDIDVHVYGRVLTEANVGIINTSPIHTLDVGSNLYVDEFGSNILVVQGNTNVTGDLTVDTDTLYVNSVASKVGINTKNPDANLHVVGNVYVSSNLTVDEDTLHVDALTHSVGIETKNPDANLHVVGNVYVSSNLTVDEDTLHVDALTHSVGIETKNPDANLHVVGNVYVSSNLTVDTDTLHVDTVADHVGINTKNPDANLHVVGNVYVSSNLTVDTDTLHVDALTHSVGIETKEPDANLHVVGNVYVTSNLTVDTDTLHVDTAADHVGINTKNPDAELHVVGNVYVSSNLTVDTDTLHVDALTHSVGIETKEPDANLHVVGNVYVTSNLTVDTDTLHVDTVADHVGINTKNPDAELHVVGNVYVSSNLTVDTDTLHVDALTHSVGIETKNPDANLHVVGNTYVSSNLTVDTDTLHVDALTHSVGIETKDPDANLHVEGNVYVSSNLTVDTDTFHVDTVADHVGINTKNPAANLHVEGNTYVSNTLTLNDPTTALVTDLTSNVLVKLNQLSNVEIDTTSATESLRSDHILVYDGSNWINDYPKHTYVKVFNDSGVELKTGNVVYVVGTHNANLLEVALAKADDPATMPAFGVVTSNILQSGEGVAVTYGKAQVSGIQDFVEGETVYVSNVHAGMLSNIKPFYTDDVPNLIQNVGIVTKSGGGAGSIFVTGVGRANDVPNAQIVEDEGDINWVYVNNVNNDFKKIVPSNLLTQLQTLEQVSAAGNNVSNIISFSNVTTGIVTTGNVQVGSNISVIGLADPSNKYLPMVDTTGTFIKSPVYVTDGGKYVISASEAEFLGNITLGGNTTIISSTSVTIEDRIFGVGANNSVTGLDSGFMIEHQHEAGDYANIALIHHASDHRFAIGYTQNTFTDDHILYYQYPSRNLLVDLQGDVDVQNTLSVGQTMTVTGASTLKDDLTVGLVSNLFVDVSTSRVGINEASPEKSLDVNGTGRFKDTTDSTTTSTGALIVSGGLGVASNIHSTNVYATTHMAVGTSPTSVPLEVRASGTDAILVKNVGETAADHAKLALEVTSGSGGDPYLTMKTNSTTFAAGVDNSDNDIFKISNGSALGTNDRLKITPAGVTTITNTTEATSTTSGALIVSGGLGVASNINVTNVYVLGTTAASSKTTGALQVRGGLGVQGSVYAASLHTDDYVSHIDDTNTRIGFPAVDTFVVETSGTERIRVDSVGRLGVGTTAPQAKLHVVGNAYVSSNLTVGASNLFVDTTSGRVGVGSASPNSNLHVVGNVYVSSNLTVGASNFFVDTTTGGVGIGTNTPEYKLDVHGTSNVGVLTVSNATEATSTSTGALIVSGGLGVASNINATNVYVLGSTTSSSKTTGALQVTGGVGVGGSLYATELFTDENIVHTGDTDTYIGFPAADTFVVETNGNERLRVDSSGNIGINDSTPEYKLDVNGTGRFTGVLTGDAGVSVTDTTQATSTTTGALTVAGGISTQTNVHASNVYIAGGLVTNTGGVTKKTYSHTGTITSGTQPYMNVNFTNHIFYARITAQLVEGDEELSTMVLECGGGNKSGSSPTTNIALGTKNVFGGVSTNPWSSVVIAEPTRLAMIPSTALGGTGEYHIFIEYTSPNAGGGVTTIDEDTTAAVTFGY